MKINVFILVAANILVYYLLYQSMHRNLTLNTKNNTNDSSILKKDCSKCKWKLRKECSVVEGICNEKPEYNNDETNCKLNGFVFNPSGIISKKQTERCNENFANACFDDSNDICSSETCSEMSWVPKGCSPYKEVGVCLNNREFDNRPEMCSGDYVVNGIVKTA